MKLRELTIIQYQNVSHKPQLNRLWLSCRAFNGQIEHLLRNPFQFLSMDDALSYMEGGLPLTDLRPISITFDHGYRDFYRNVLPTLTQHNIPATVLISPPKVGQSLTMNGDSVEYLSWDQLEELTNHNITLGAYEDNAWNINAISEEMVREHIIDYKKMIEDRLGIEVRYFGVKEGIPKPGIRDLLISKGYRAFLTECPTNQKPDLYGIGRVQVDDDDFNIFLTKISRTYLFLKDKKSWKYIREYRLDRVAHRFSETYDKLRGMVNTGR